MDHSTIAKHLSSSVKVKRSGEPRLPQIPVAAAMARPEVDRRSLLEDAYDEYCQRSSQGEEIDASSFCNRFPACRSSLGRRLLVHELLNQNSRVFEESLLATWPEPGERFLRFVLLEELGRGATSRVFMAEETGLGQRRVVVKISRMAADEAETLGKLNHRNIVPVYSVEEEPTSGFAAICMPYFCDTTVDDFIDCAFPEGVPPTALAPVMSQLRRNQRPIESNEHDALPLGRSDRRSYVNGVLDFAAQLFDALAHTHARGVLHLDLKPSNVLITPDGCPLLLDFNLSADRSLGVGLSGGTLPYMSPEQIRAAVLDCSAGVSAVDHRSDIYSLGVTLYQLLSGRHPFESVNWKRPSEVVARDLLVRQKQVPDELRHLNPHVDARIEQFIRRCLAVDPSNRPQDAAEAARACRQNLSPIRRTHRWSRAHRRLSGAISAVLLAVVIGLGYGVYSWATQPTQFEYCLEAGYQEFDNGDFEEAMVYFNEAIDLDSTSGEARFARGRARLAVRNFSGAFDDFIEAQRLSPKPRNFAYTAVCAQAQGNDSLAEFYYKEAIQGGLQTAAIWNNLGRSYSNHAKLREEFELADSCFKKALDLEPGFQGALHNRAVNAINEAGVENDVNRRIERVKLAVDYADDALEKGPRTPELLVFAATCIHVHATYVRIHRPDDASRANSAAATELISCLEEAADMGVDLQKVKSLKQLKNKMLEEIFERNPGGKSLKPIPRVFDPTDRTPLLHV